MKELMTDWRVVLFIALVFGPLLWMIFIGLGAILLKELKAVRKWYYGLPIYQYPAMLLVILGVRHLRKPYGMWKKFEGRWWFSVKAEGFIDEKDVVL